MTLKAMKVKSHTAATRAEPQIVSCTVVDILESIEVTTIRHLFEHLNLDEPQVLVIEKALRL